MKAWREAGRVLGLESLDNDWVIPLRSGARTRCVAATAPGTPHRFQSVHSEVVVKLYKGDGSSTGSQEYQDYHQNHFRLIPALTDNAFIQQSLEGGVMPDVGPYAVAQYIPGEELAVVLDNQVITQATAGAILYDILLEIWIPLWHASLRFKDCHPGNFILTPSGRTRMIDTEQMRKDVKEHLSDNDNWSQRDRHEDSGLKRLPRLIQRALLSANPGMAKAPLLRDIKQLISETGVSETFRQLGRTTADSASAQQAVKTLLAHLKTRRLIA